MNQKIIKQIITVLLILLSIGIVLRLTKGVCKCGVSSQTIQYSTLPADPQTSQLIPITPTCSCRHKLFVLLSNILILVSILFLTIFIFDHFVNNKITKKVANMISVCEACDIYTERRKAYRPFKKSEIKLLENYTEACKRCSDECIKDFNLSQEVSKITGNPKIKELFRKKCIGYTENAILSKKELERLESN